MGILKDRTLIILVIILGILVVVFGFSVTMNDQGIRLYDINKLHWYEYKMESGGSLAPTPDHSPYIQYWDIKVVYDTVEYGGVHNARHMSQVELVHDYSNNWSIISDLYYDPTNNYRLLGGHWNNSAREQDVMADDSLYRNYDPAIEFLEPIDNNFTYSGTETVTVPAGTFNCTKYTTTEGDSIVTYWHASNVPLPVKKEARLKVYMYLYNNFELVGYG